MENSNRKRIFNVTDDHSKDENTNQSIYNFDDSSIIDFKKCGNDLKNKINKSLCDKNFYKKILFKRIPILKWLPNYKLNYFLPDMISGLTGELYKIKLIL